MRQRLPVLLALGIMVLAMLAFAGSASAQAEVDHGFIGGPGNPSGQVETPSGVFMLHGSASGEGSDHVVTNPQGLGVRHVIDTDDEVSHGTTTPSGQQHGFIRQKPNSGLGQ